MRLASSRASLRGRDDGMSLMEVVVAVVLLGVLSTLVVSLVLQAQAKTVDNRSRVAASNLAAREIDLVREQFMRDGGPAAVEAAGVAINANSLNGAGKPSQVDGQSYTVKRSVSWNVTGTGKSACEGGSLVEYPTMAVRVEVTWPKMGSVRPVVNTTQLAPPKGTSSGAKTTAYVAVKVKDAAGEPNPGRSVTVSTTSGGGGVTGVTDESGCAVLQVTPAASGTDYVATVSDSGYVDQANAPTVTRSVGILVPGQLSSSIDVAYDRAVTLDVRMSGTGLTDADVAGSDVSIFRGGSFVGSSPTSTHQMTGLRTLIGGLWPGDYAAFLGAVVPPTVELTTVAPGTTAVLEVGGAMARVRFDDVPWGADVVAVPGTATSCTATGARPVSTSDAQLLPGTWTFFAKHEGFGCAPGPAGLELVDGDNGTQAWATSKLAVTGAPSGFGDKIWAVSSKAATTTCQPPAKKAHAVAIGSAPGATSELPAGDWYVFVTQEAGGGPSATASCASAGLVNVAYDGVTTFAWPSAVPGPGGRP